MPLEIANYVGNVNPRFPLARGPGGWHYISLPRGPERPQAAYLGNRIPRGAGETLALRRRKTDGIFENHLLKSKSDALIIVQGHISVPVLSQDVAPRENGSDRRHAGRAGSRPIT